MINYSIGKLLKAAALASSATIAIIPCGAAAQDTPVSTSNNPEASAIGDIIITSRRREELLQHTPVAVTALSANDLQNRGVENLIDIGNFVPNVVAGSQSTGGTQNGAFFIRGIGQERTQITFDQGVGLYVDDIYYGRSDSALLAIVDVDRVEVLRGPQGTLFGKNTIGGAVRYVTRKPTADFGGYVDATIGRFDRTDVKASINLPLAEGLYAKATVGVLRRDGFVKHVVDDGKNEGDEDTRVARLQLRYQPSDNLTIDLQGSMTRIDTNGRAFKITDINPNATYAQRLRQKTGQIYDARYLTSGRYSIYGGRPSSYDYDGYDLSAVIDLKLSDTLSVKSISGFNRAKVQRADDYDGTALPLFDTGVDRRIKQFSEELQLAGTAIDDRLNFVAGAFYMRETPHDVGTVLTPFDAFFPAQRVIYTEQKTNSYALYGQGTFKLTSKLSFTAGLRYSRDEKTLFTENRTTNLAGTSNGSWSSVSPRVSAEYQWNRDIMTYVSAARGFRSGGINAGLTAGAGRNQVLPIYNPENVWTYEAGVRADLFQVLRLNATAFTTKYKSLQLTALDVPTNIVFIQNVGKAHIDGLEVESILALSKRFRMQGTFGYLPGSYDDLGTARGVTLDSRIVRKPKYNYSLGARYTADLGKGSVTFSGDWSWRASQSTTSQDSNTAFIDSYGTANARIQYDSPDKNWSAALAVTNLTNKLYYVGGIDFFTRETIVGIRQLDYGRPREWNVNLKYRF